MGLILNTLGRLEIGWNEQPVTELTLRKSQALLVYLALNPNSHNRSQLAGLLWGELPESNARRNLRHALHTLRANLDPAILDSDRLSAGLHPDVSRRIDTLDFTNALAEARRHQRSGDYDVSLMHLQRAVDLYQGDFLEGFDILDSAAFEVWMTSQRVYLRVQCLDALDTLVTHWTQRGVYERALCYARLQLALEPMSETSHRQLMRLLALTGQRDAALTQYQICRRMLIEELGLEPLEETTALYYAIRKASLEISGQVSGIHTELPQSALPFVGREEEHTALVSAWETARHGEGKLTLVAGEAGVGKTRLIDEVLRFIVTHGSTVLRGRCYEFGGNLPYQPIAEALRVHLRKEQLELSPIWMAELTLLLPDLHEVHPSLPDTANTGGEAARQRLFEAVTRLFLSLCDAGPALCLFIDDLHWADTSTLDLLHYLVRHLATAPIWLVGTFRPEETGWSHALTRLRQGLSRDHRVMRLVLNPLEGDSVQQLAQSLVGEKDGVGLARLYPFTRQKTKGRIS